MTQLLELNPRESTLQPDEVLAPNDFFIPFSKIRDGHLLIVGGKTWNLHRVISNTNLSVPDGFVITTKAKELYEHDLVGLQAALSSHVPLDPIRGYAVRSSAVVEDGRDQSYSGIFDSLLNVSPDKISDSVQAVWSSASSEKVAEYQGGLQQKIEMAVIIQEMIDGETSGVAFSADPVTNDRNITVVKAVSGLCDKLTSGKTTGSHYKLNRSTSQITGSDELLTTGQIWEVGQAAAAIEKLFNTPVDIEWSYKDGKLYILQARPISAINNDTEMRLLSELAGRPSDIDFTQFITRPESFFSLTCIMHGITLMSGNAFDNLAIQEADNPVQYRIYVSRQNAVVCEKLQKAIASHDLTGVDSDLQQGIDVADELNRILIKSTEEIISEYTFPKLFELYRKYMWYSAALPFSLGNVLGESQVEEDETMRAIREKIILLRSTQGEDAIYIERLLEPSAQKWFAVGGIEISIADIRRLTVKEVLARDFSQLVFRERGRLYYFQRDQETAFGSSSFSPEIIFGIEKTSLVKTDILVGTIGRQGRVRGRARRIEKYDLEHLDKIEFNEGDILITGCYSPGFALLLRKAGGVASEEGGGGTHAANLLKEFGVPMVYGVANLIAMIKDGDEIEIDCSDPNKGGIVKIIKRFQPTSG